MKQSVIAVFYLFASASVAFAGVDDLDRSFGGVDQGAAAEGGATGAVEHEEIDGTVIIRLNEETGEVEKAVLPQYVSAEDGGAELAIEQAEFVPVPDAQIAEGPAELDAMGGQQSWYFCFICFGSFNTSYRYAYAYRGYYYRPYYSYAYYGYTYYYYNRAYRWV